MHWTPISYTVLNVESSILREGRFSMEREFAQCRKVEIYFINMELNGIWWRQKKSEKSKPSLALVKHWRGRLENVLQGLQQSRMMWIFNNSDLYYDMIGKCRKFRKEAENIIFCCLHSFLHTLKLKAVRLGCLLYTPVRLSTK